MCPEDSDELRAFIRNQIASQLTKKSGEAKPMWEDQITVRQPARAFTALSSVSEYRNGRTCISPESLRLEKSIDEYVRSDPYPLPTPEDRENYGADRHFEYWLSGLSDYLSVKFFLKAMGASLGRPFSLFDLGCASGRVIRHFLHQEEGLDVWGSDISSRHIEWIIRHLGDGAKAFQNHTLPHLPFEDNRFDLVSAFSVFSHIDAFELAWLLEIRRILKPGGFAYLSIHSEHTWSLIRPELPVCQALIAHPEFSLELLNGPLPEEKLVYRWRTDNGYRANVFYETDYVRRVWGRFFEVIDVVREAHHYQDVVLLRKQ